MAQATTFKALLENVKTVVEALEFSSGIPLFASSYIAADMRLEDMEKTLRWPCAVITDFGAEVNSQNPRFCRATVSITVVVKTGRADFGQSQTLDCIDRCDKLRTGLGERQDIALSFVSSSPISAVQLGQGPEYVVGKEMVFSAQIDLGEYSFTPREADE